MKVLVWITEATWPACVDAVTDLFPDAEVRLLAAVPGDVAARSPVRAPVCGDVAPVATPVHGSR
ncbi:MAG: hypothetical protein U0R79_03905 [Propionicimonas sp.]